jgi:hypothetical protein
MNYQVSRFTPVMHTCNRQSCRAAYRVIMETRSLHQCLETETANPEIKLCSPPVLPMPLQSPLHKKILLSGRSPAPLISNHSTATAEIHSPPALPSTTVASRREKGHTRRESIPYPPLIRQRQQVTHHPSTINSVTHCQT